MTTRATGNQLLLVIADVLREHIYGIMYAKM